MISDSSSIKKHIYENIFTYIRRVMISVFGYHYMDIIIWISLYGYHYMGDRYSAPKRHSSPEYKGVILRGVINFNFSLIIIYD